MNLTKVFQYLFLTSSLCLIAACGGGDNASTVQAFNIAYTAPAMGEKEGKTVFTLDITDQSTGEAATGLNITISPVMHMTSMDHSTPLGAIVDNDDGSYSVTIYYLMATMGDQGWELTVTASDGTKSSSTTITPTVAMAMGDTAKVVLQGQADMVAIMGGQKRKYFLFHDGLSGMTGNHSFKVFAATRDSLMSHPAVYVGKSLTDENSASWDVTAMTVQASTDATNWTNMSDDGNGYWSVNNLSGLTDSEAGSIYVKLSVISNALTEQKTTNGNAPDGTNEYQTFTVTP